LAHIRVIVFDKNAKSALLRRTPLVHEMT